MEDGRLAFDREDDRPDEQDRLGNLLADLTKVHGPVTEEELAAARAEWLGR